ncbi:membrane protein [Caballeronia choica]|uniref:Membrane protein n=1 Tax=Caballeronia choica TaxID=326476 RepID=A0A158KFT9_9BURK|nr:membrane protein [Caballeronia choica]
MHARLHKTPSSSLLLNLEGVFTAVIAWVVFRENVDLQIFLGMVAIVLGGVVLSWQPGATGVSSGALLVFRSLRCVGCRLQFDAQGFGEQRNGHCLPERFCRRLSQSVHRADSRRTSARRWEESGRDGHGLRWLRRQPSSLCCRPAKSRNRPNRRVLFSRPDIRHRLVAIPLARGAITVFLECGCAHGSGNLAPYP